MNCRAEARILEEKENWTQMKEGERAGNKRKGGRELKRSKRLKGRRRQQNNNVVY